MARKIFNTIQRDGTYHFKKRIPKRLQYTREFQGKQFVQYTLSTRDSDEAASLLSDCLIAFEQSVVRAEKELGIAKWESRARSRKIPPALVMKPTIEQIETAADQFYKNYIRENPTYEDGLLTREAARGIEQIVAGKRIEDWEHILSELGKPADENVRSFDAAIKIYESNGWVPEPEDKYFIILQDLLRRAEKTVIKLILQESRSDTFVPSDQRKQLFQGSDSNALTLSSAIERYEQSNPENKDIIKKMRSAHRVWMELIGIDPISAITREIVKNYIAVVIKIPKRTDVRFANLKIAAAIEANSALSKPYDTIKPKTAKINYVSVLGAAVEVYVEAEKIKSNPFTGHSIEGSDNPANHRRPFKTHELIDIFHHPIFTGCKSRLRRYTPGATVIRDSLFWAPLIALFSGLRASEIGALQPSDLKELRGLKGELWYLNVDGTKTGNANREVPVHPELIRLGIVDLFKHAKVAGNKRVFEEWKKPKDKKYSEARVIRNFSEKVCAEFGLPGDRPTFHCFRQTLITKMSSAGLDLKFQRAIIGHSQQGMDRAYYKPYIEDYAEPFSRRISFEGLDLSHLHP